MAENRRFPPPWIVERPNEDAFIVKDAKGLALATIRCRDEILRSSFGHNRLTSDEGVQGVPELKVKQALKGHKDRSVRRVRGRQRGRGNSRSCRSKGEPATSSKCGCRPSCHLGKAAPVSLSRGCPLSAS
jgi:hypothetical protein